MEVMHWQHAIPPWHAEFLLLAKIVYRLKYQNSYCLTFCGHELNFKALFAVLMDYSTYVAPFPPTLATATWGSRLIAQTFSE